MKTNIKTILAAVCLVSLLVLSCKGESEKGNQTEDQTVESTEMQGKEYTSAYVCPMHCEGSGSDEEGNCPECGMAYVARADHENDGHKH